MRRFHFTDLISLILFLSLQMCWGQDKNYVAVEGATHRVEVLDALHPGLRGHCSGTAIAPHAVLTAGHCNDNGNTALIDEKLFEIALTINDGHDHLILLLPKITFKEFVKPTQRKLIESEDVFIIGDPKGLHHQYRRGVVSGSGAYDDGAGDGSIEDVDEGSKKAAPKLTEYELDLNAFFGDSGAGLFDSKGHLVSVLSFHKVIPDENHKDARFVMQGALEMTFTPNQLALAEGFGSE